MPDNQDTNFFSDAGFAFRFTGNRNNCLEAMPQSQLILISKDKCRNSKVVQNR